ncbi:uncharacterized protein TNCV_1148291 [Trichonephila clavipes]|nr:uncharacterized protein TNCV_1148291 [Trichonephila clavipes]
MWFCEDCRQEEEAMDWEDAPVLPEVSAPFVPSRPPRKMRSLISVQVSEPPSLSANRFPNMRALVPKDLVQNPGEGLFLCKYILPSRHGGTLNSRRAASPLVRLVEKEDRWEAPDHPQGVLPKNWGGTEQNRTFTYMGYGFVLLNNTYQIQTKSAYPVQWLVTLTAMPLDLGSSLGEGMDVCKCIILLDTPNSR